MNNSISRAIRVQIKIGEITVNAYRLPDGRDVLAGRNVTDCVSISNHKDLGRKLGVKSLKALPNADLSLGQVKADSGETFIPVALEDAVTYWTILSGQGNKKAAALLGALAIEALKRRVDHRLGTIKEEEEYEAYTDMVCTRLMARKAWTDTLRDHHMKLYGTSPTPEQYKDWTVTVNLALFNQKHFNCDRTENMTPDQQRLIIDFERTATRMTSKYPTATPGKIIEKALLTF